MKRNFTYLAFTLTILAVVKYANLTSKPSSTPSGGYAGEPANNRSCASSGCHSGTDILDASQFSLKMAFSSADLASNPLTSTTTYLPDTTYWMSLQLNGTANRYGFSLAAQTATNAQAGTFTVTNATSTTTVTGASGKTNMSHKSANTTKSWIWKWKSPNTTTPINFYYVGMLADGNGNESGDVVYKSSVSITGAPNAIQDIKNLHNFSVYPTQTLSDIALNVDAVENTTASLILVDMTGHVVKELYQGEFAIGENNLRFNISDLPVGNYILNLKTPTASAAKRIVKL